MFGRVAPEDKLRLARLMQESGEVVAMTGDAVNDAAALKQADIGVAMGSGSEVSKQAAKIVLTDDNFATLVRAIDLGRDIYRRISSYVKLQLTILSSVLQLMVYATILNINHGIALFPLQLLFCKFFVVITVVIGFIADVPDPSVMQRPPRKPGTKMVNRPQLVRWFASGFLVAAIVLAVLEWGPGKPSTTHASVNMTMAFAIVSFSAVNLGLVMRREREPAWSRPLFPYLGWIILGWILTWAAVELGMFQRLLNTAVADRRASGWRCSACRLSCRPRSAWTRPSSCTVSATPPAGGGGRGRRWSSRRPGPRRGLTTMADKRAERDRGADQAAAGQARFEGEPGQGLRPGLQGRLREEEGRRGDHAARHRRCCATTRPGSPPRTATGCSCACRRSTPPARTARSGT